MINVPYNVIKSCHQEKAALPTSVPMLPTEINGHSNVDFHVFKKQTSESAICQSLNNPRMGFSVLYKSRNSKSTILKHETTMFFQRPFDSVWLFILRLLEASLSMRSSW